MSTDGHTTSRGYLAFPAAFPVAFQGAPGAYSDMAAHGFFGDNVETLPCATFADAFAAVRDGAAGHAVIPVDNTLAGRVADVHDLLPEGGLAVVGEYFLPIRHNLLGLPGTAASAIRHVWSHTHALPQCRKLLRRLGAAAHVHADTAGAAKMVAEQGDPAHAAIAGALAAQLYGLEIIEADVQDANHNTTRFLILARDAVTPPADRPTLASIVFTVTNRPAALHEALGAFAAPGLNLAKLESYQDMKFRAARFYCEVEAHPESAPFREAWAALQQKTGMLRLLGAYAADEYRQRVLTEKE